jgi:hypothetical protein
MKQKRVLIRLAIAMALAAIAIVAIRMHQATDATDAGGRAIPSASRN